MVGSDGRQFEFSNISEKTRNELYSPLVGIRYPQSTIW